MSQTQNRLPALIAFLLILLLILFGKSAAIGTAEGIELCIHSVIPALFPFFVLTNWGLPYLMQMKIPGLSTLSRYLHIPKGAEMILIIGLLGGYPVGAQTISAQWQQGKLTQSQAHHLMGFCSNVGPGFIFGTARILFQNPIIPWCIWGIQIVSAFITGLLLPFPVTGEVRLTRQSAVSITTAMRKSVAITGLVCGWIIFTKAILGIITPVITSEFVKVCLTGVIELSAGCFTLTLVQNAILRFTLINAFLSFGGICVLMQTNAVADDLGTGLYVPGKAIQMLISIQMSILTSYFLFPDYCIKLNCVITIIIPCWIILFFLRKISRKRCGNYLKIDVQ